MPREKEAWTGEINFPIIGQGGGNGSGEFELCVTLDRDPDRPVRIRVPREAAETIGKSILRHAGTKGNNHD